MNDTRLFDFESDFVATLRCVPMAVQFKLDTCGIKLSLRQWSRFTPADRHALLLAPCEAKSEVEAYRAQLEGLIAHRSGGEVKRLEETPAPAWAQSDATPTAVQDFAHTVQVSPPSDSDWARLSPLERFVLLKLSRDNHDNVNFVPALREFGLVSNENAQDLRQYGERPRRRRATS